MPRYSIHLAPSAERDLAALDKPIQRRVVARIDSLSDNGDPSTYGCSNNGGALDCCLPPIEGGT